MYLNNKSDILRFFIQEYNVSNSNDVQNMLKDLFAGTIQEMLDSEMEDHLGYSKYDYKNKEVVNCNNKLNINN